MHQHSSDIQHLCHSVERIEQAIVQERQCLIDHWVASLQHTWIRSYSLLNCMQKRQLTWCHQLCRECFNLLFSYYSSMCSKISRSETFKWDFSYPNGLAQNFHQPCIGHSTQSLCLWSGANKLRLFRLGALYFQISSPKRRSNPGDRSWNLFPKAILQWIAFFR